MDVSRQELLTAVAKQAFIELEQGSPEFKDCILVTITLVKAQDGSDNWVTNMVSNVSPDTTAAVLVQALQIVPLGEAVPDAH